MRALSNDLRERIIAAVDNQEGSRRQTRVASPSTSRPSPGCSNSAARPALSCQGPTAAARTPPSIRAPWNDSAVSWRNTPMPRSSELRQHLGIAGSIMIVWRALKKLGITRRKDRARRRAGSTRCPEKRRVPPRRSSRSSPKRLVFVDETGVTTAMTPTYGRAPRGERVASSAPASWESVTLIAALGLDGVRAPMAVSGSSNAATFLAYVEQVLVPAFRPGDVVVFNNLASHFTPGVAKAIERVGARVLPLPPYSPDLNPIEEMFSKLKETAATGRGTDEGPSRRGDRRSLEAGRRPRHHRLVPASRTVCNVNVNRSRNKADRGTPPPCSSRSIATRTPPAGGSTSSPRPPAMTLRAGHGWRTGARSGLTSERAG